MNSEIEQPILTPETLRIEISKEYSVVATNPERDFHFHTGRKLAGILEYDEELINSVPDSGLESFAGTGNPFAVGGTCACSDVIL